MQTIILKLFQNIKNLNKVKMKQLKPNPIITITALYIVAILVMLIINWIKKQ